MTKFYTAYLKELMSSRGLKAIEIAKRTNTPRSTVSKWLSGYAAAYTPRAVSTFAKVLGLDHLEAVRLLARLYDVHCTIDELQEAASLRGVIHADKVANRPTYEFKSFLERYIRESQLSWLDVLAAGLSRASFTRIAEGQVPTGKEFRAVAASCGLSNMQKLKLLIVTYEQLSD